MDFPLPSNDPNGTDVELDQNGDLVINTFGDFNLITDADNVAQSTRTSLMTIPDTYLWDDGSLGTNLAQYVDDPITSYDEDLIKSEITQVLNNDDRIVEITSIDIDSTSIVDGLLITIEAYVDSVGVVQIPIVIGGV